MREAGRGTTPIEIELPVPTPSPAALVGHIVGEVANPGVYRVPPGTRLFEAIEMAGGSLANADTEAINLALPVDDGRRYEIPSIGEGDGGTTDTSGALLDRINLNVATRDELESLPGIGPKLA